MKRYSRRFKFAVIAVSAAVGVCAYFAAYSAFEADMTEWQRTQKIDFSANTGSTKFKARIDALSVGGAAFCVCAAAAMATKKLFGKQWKKR